VRVLLLTLCFAPDMVSNAVVATEIAEDLAAQGHAVTVVSAMPHHYGHGIYRGYRGRPWHASRHGSIKVYRTWLMVRGEKTNVSGRMVTFATFNLTSTVAALCTGPQDVVITLSPPLTIGLTGWMVAKLRDARFVYNVQDIYPDAAVSLGLIRNQSAIRFARGLERFVYDRADAVTVISEDFRQNLLRKGVPDSKIVLIPNGVDTVHIQPTARANEFSHKNGLDGKFVALYAGNVGLAQGLEVLVDAAAETKSANVLYLVVGSGAALESLRARARAARCENVRFLPFEPRERVAQVYGASEVGLVILRRGLGSTSLPSKLYTIMASGRAVVASVDPESETWRLVEAVGCGVCVPPGDPAALARAVEALEASPERARALGERGRDYVVSQCSRRVVGERYHRLVEVLGKA
jgi:colanic acid biosynthesis glycosyl transferase WcaI